MANFAFRRGKKYYIRVRIPKDLMTAFGCREIKKTLGVSDVPAATLAHRVWAGKVATTFAMLRTGIAKPEQIPQLLDGLFGHHKKAGKETVAVAKAEAPTIEALVEKQVAEGIKAGLWREKYINESGAYFRLLTRVLGNRPVKEITHQDLIHFRDVFSRLPPNVNKSPMFRGKSLDEILAMSPGKTLDTKTMNKALTRIGVFFKWCHRHDYIATNPAHDLMFPENIRPDLQRASYTGEEISKIISRLPQERVVYETNCQELETCTIP